MLTSITTAQKEVLFSLAQYQYLTTSQFLRLGITTLKQNLSKQVLIPLRDLKLIDCADFAVTQRIDNKVKTKRVESFYYLTSKGKNLIIKHFHLEESSIKYPKGAAKLFNDKYWHRKYAIDCEIEVNLWAKNNSVNIVQFDRDFDKTSNNKAGTMQSKTKLVTGKRYHIIPDANFHINDGKDWLFTFELHNKRTVKDISQQLVNHTYAVENGSLGLKYNVPKAHRVLNVFVEENKMVNVIKRISGTKHFYGMEQFFFFKTLHEINDNFFENWMDLEGNKVALL